MFQPIVNQKTPIILFLYTNSLSIAKMAAENEEPISEQEKVYKMFWGVL